MKKYIKDNLIKYINQIIVSKDGFNISNPSEEEILADGWVEYKEPEPILPTEEELLEQAKENKLYEIIEYDLSEEVNSFTYKGIKMWFNKADRVGLRNSLEIEKRIGRTESTMWFGNIPIVVNIDEGLRLLDAIELYALDCYNTTSRHKSEVRKLTTVEEIERYDITKEYPEKLNL